MEKNILTLTCILVVSIIILGTFSNVISIQNNGTSNRKKVRKQYQENQFFQSITSFTNKSFLASLISSVSSGNDSNVSSVLVAKLSNNDINTSVDEINPYEQTDSPLIITATGPSDLSNVTLWYRYSPKNTTSFGYMTSLKTVGHIEQPAYPNGVVSVDGIAFIPSYTGSKVTLLDVNDPENIKLLDREIEINAHDTEMTMDKKYAWSVSFTSKASRTLRMWNITDKNRISSVNHTSLSGTYGMYLWLSDDENYLYATSNAYVYIFNVTDKTTYQMNQIASFNTGKPFDLYWHPFVYGNALYVSGQDTDYDEHGLIVYNISNKEKPFVANYISTNRSIWDGLVVENNGFMYLIFDGGDTSSGKKPGYITCYNISANNETHPTWMYQVHKWGTNNNDTMGVGIAYANGYIFSQQNNPYTPAYNDGVQVYNWTDTTSPPVYLTRIVGITAPYFLNDSHVIHTDKNGSAMHIFVATCDGNSLTILDPNWSLRDDWGGWVRFGIDNTSVSWSWIFSFPNGTGYYEFYSIGQKSGLTPENPPSSKDAQLHFINLRLQANFTYTPAFPTDLETIQFTGSSPDENTIARWSWNFGDGGTSTLQNTTHVYADDGSYLVNLTVTDKGGISDSISQLINVNNVKPIADANGPYVASIDQTIILNASGSSDPDGEVIAYQWDFGDGSTGEGKDPIHKYDNIGIYTLTLLVVDDDGWTDAAATNIFINKGDPPILPLLYPTDGGIVNNTVTIRWYAYDAEDGDNLPISIYYRDSNTPTWSAFEGNPYTNDGARDWDTTTLPDGVYKLLIQTIDNEGNIGLNISTFQIKNHDEPPENHKPVKPNQPSGPSNGRKGHTYSYTTSTTDPDGDQIYYLWDWGNGNNSGWIGPYNSGATITTMNKWTVKGSYSIKVKAKDMYGKESIWSDSLPIIMPYIYRPLPKYLEWFFQRFPNAFPILRQLTDK